MLNLKVVPEIEGVGVAVEVTTRYWRYIHRIQVSCSFIAFSFHVTACVCGQLYVAGASAGFGAERRV